MKDLYDLMIKENNDNKVKHKKKGKQIKNWEKNNFTHKVNLYNKNIKE